MSVIWYYRFYLWGQCGSTRFDINLIKSIFFSWNVPKKPNWIDFMLQFLKIRSIFKIKSITSNQNICQLFFLGKRRKKSSMKQFFNSKYKFHCEKSMLLKYHRNNETLCKAYIAREFPCRIAVTVMMFCCAQNVWSYSFL